jgi:hypothetical protein
MGWTTIQKRVVLRDVRSFDFELCVICSRDDVLDVMKLQKTSVSNHLSVTDTVGNRNSF